MAFKEFRALPPIVPFLYYYLVVRLVLTGDIFQLPISVHNTMVNPRPPVDKCAVHP